MQKLNIIVSLVNRLSTRAAPSNEGLLEIGFFQLWNHTVCVSAFELRIIKFSIRIRGRYYRVYSRF